MVSYRLSSNTGGRFPAALQDAVSSLHYLFDLGIEPSNIVIGGDSAGGNLAVALLRYLEGAPDVAPLAGALLWSPWVDLASSVLPNAMASSPYQWTDYVGDAFANWGCAAYCPKGAPVSIEDGWISPRRHPFFTKTPVWIQGSGQEVLIDDITAFAEGMKRIPGNNVTFHVEELANHDIILVGNATGFDKEAENAAKEAAQWLGKQ
jgi:acetyl esterase/lipase